jgi:hypothetical protein
MYTLPASSFHLCSCESDSGRTDGRGKGGWRLLRIVGAVAFQAHRGHSHSPKPATRPWLHPPPGLACRHSISHLATPAAQTVGRRRAGKAFRVVRAGRGWCGCRARAWRRGFGLEAAIHDGGAAICPK